MMTIYIIVITAHMITTELITPEAAIIPTIQATTMPAIITPVETISATLAMTADITTQAAITSPSVLPVMIQEASMIGQVDASKNPMRIGL
jgi:hypothetical protein